MRSPGPKRYLGGVQVYDDEVRFGKDKQITQSGSRLVTAEFVDILMLADFFVRLGLNLADALAGDSKLFAHFFQGMRDTIDEPVAHFQNLALLG